jgi:DNA-binding SARP family transcriptional activator
MPKALLKLLAVQRDRSLHREQVLDAFWASLNPSAAAANLRKILFDLRAEFTARQVKAQVVTIAEDMVVLSPEISLDIDEFRSWRGRPVLFKTDWICMRKPSPYTRATCL